MVDYEPTIYTIWVILDTGEYCRLRSFPSAAVAEKFLEYVEAFFEHSDDHPQVEEVFLKADDEPVYQIYYLNPEGAVEVMETESEIYVNLEEVVEELANLSESNPYTQYGYQEVDIDADAETYEVPDL